MQNIKHSPPLIEAEEPPREVQGQWASAEETLFVGIGEEIFKRNLPFLNDVLRQLLTTSIALSGGTLMFLSDPQCHKGMKLTAAAMFALAMICSFIGILPYRDSVRLDVPAEIKENVKAATWWKYSWICGSITFIFLGLALAFLGVLVGVPAL